jgi:hypothetical protein
MRILVCLSFFLSFCIKAQSLYDLRFANPDLQCQAHQLCINLDIKATNLTESFAIGSHSIIFSFNKNIINNPIYTSYLFNYTDSCIGGVIGAYLLPSFSYDPNTGEGNLTTVMQVPNFGCPLVTSNWATMGQFCFDVIAYNQDIALQINPNLTLFNLNTDQPAHLLNSLQTINVSPDCSDYDDPDQDGLLNLEEATLGTDPNNPDSDTDGLLDGEEVQTYQTDPNNADSDQDGLSDGLEINLYITNPNNEDTDGDTLADGNEISEYGSDPNNADTDNDLLPDGTELIFETNLNNPDSDADGLLDGEEVLIYQTNPNNADSDNDDIGDSVELFTYTTNPNNPDTDGDTITDNNELFVTNTNPNNPDSDEDTINDYTEIYLYNTNPNTPDTDQDGVPDGLELDNEQPIDTDNDTLIDALDPDDDNDNIPTANEDNNNNNNWFDDDDDNDGIPDFRDADAVGISPTLSTSPLLLYPNPFTNYLQIVAPQNTNIQQVSVYTTTGQQVAQFTNINNRFNLHNLPTGTYLVQLISKQNTIVWQKVVKQ